MTRTKENAIRLAIDTLLMPLCLVGMYSSIAAQDQNVLAIIFYVVSSILLTVETASTLYYLVGKK